MICLSFQFSITLSTVLLLFNHYVAFSFFSTNWYPFAEVCEDVFMWFSSIVLKVHCENVSSKLENFSRGIFYIFNVVVLFVYLLNLSAFLFFLFLVFFFFFNPACFFFSLCLFTLK